MGSYAHSFSFSGGGWMMIYEFGVARELQRHGLAASARFIGASAGALAATALAIEADFDAVAAMIVNEHVAIAYESVHGPFRIREILRDGFSRHLQLDKYTALNAEPGKATIVVTSLSAMTSRRKTCGFQSADHLMETLLASCCLPPLAGVPFRLDGELILDGGVLDNQPMFDDDPHGKHTVTISPNYFSSADIKPSHYLPPWWFAFPSSAQDTQWAYELGQADALRWLVAKGLAPDSELAKADRVKPLQWKTRVGRWSGYRALDAELSQVAVTLLTVAGLVAVALLQVVHTNACVMIQQRTAAVYALGIGTSLVVTLLCL